jgi:hypothetical protein
MASNAYLVKIGWHFAELEPIIRCTTPNLAAAREFARAVNEAPGGVLRRPGVKASTVSQWCGRRLSRSAPLARTFSVRAESIGSRTRTARYYETAQWRAKVLRNLLVLWLRKSSFQVHRMDGMFLVTPGDVSEKAVSHSMQPFLGLLFWLLSTFV